MNLITRIIRAIIALLRPVERQPPRPIKDPVGPAKIIPERISAAGLQELRDKEGFEPRPYYDLVTEKATKQTGILRVVAVVGTEYWEFSATAKRYTTATLATHFDLSKATKTVGIGITENQYRFLTGNPLTNTTVLTESEALALVDRYFDKNGIFELLHGKCRVQGAFDALCSFAFNTGKGALTTQYEPKLSNHRAPTSQAPGPTTLTGDEHVPEPITIPQLCVQHNYRAVANCMSWWRTPRILVPRRDAEITALLTATDSL